MRILKRGILKLKKVKMLLPKMFLGIVECNNCKAKVKIEAKDEWIGVDYYDDYTYYVNCEYCCEQIYLGSDDLGSEVRVID